ncbi:unnamed protein product [marine sediment metagenome]|uniref:Uncharacterized protein n=1 Tax=marine sediment metagenome TaxID=412755 RepID=X1BID5_9ZZZZ
MLFGSNNSATFFAHLKFKFVGLGHCGSIHIGQVPLVRELYAGFGGAILLAIAAKNAGIGLLGDSSYRRISFKIVNLSERIGWTDIYTGTAADAGIEVEFRFTPVPFRHYTRLSRETSSESRRKDRGDGFFQFS